MIEVDGGGGRWLSIASYCGLCREGVDVARVMLFLFIVVLCCLHFDVARTPSLLFNIFICGYLCLCFLWMIRHPTISTGLGSSAGSDWYKRQKECRCSVEER